MPFIQPEIVIQRVIKTGLDKLRRDRAAFDDLFAQYVTDELAVDYGQNYLNQIWDWFSTTKIPVIKAWGFNAQQVPCISILLASETEDEGKAAVGDFMGTFDEVSETGTGVFTVMLDIGLHANRAGDHVLWMYYIVSYILFKHKLMADRLGLRLHTFSASDYSKKAEFMGENIWTRWIRFKCTVEHTWGATPLMEVEDVNIDPAVDLTPASDIATSRDVDPSTVDPTANSGLDFE